MEGSLAQFLTQQFFPGLLVLERELLLFAAFWFIIGAIDEIAIDLSWLWLKLTGRLTEVVIARADERAVLDGRAAVFVAAWQEANVIGSMIAHTLAAWPQREMTLYVGCYCNDPATIRAAMKGAGGDPRVRIVINGNAGPTTKADCLNRLYKALCADEDRGGFRFRSVILHDAEDMVHPAAITVIDRGLRDAQFVQLPVRPEPQPRFRWVAGHYADEFAEAHAKTMVVRNAIGAGIPAAGVGCGFARDVLSRLADQRRAAGGEGPFAADCLTEDYELGLLISRDGGRSRFLRLRDHVGGLVATRAYFPHQIDASVRQKARWIHGIALQGWDRLGWFGGPVDIWMALRDRRGLLTALVLAVGYGLVVIEGILFFARYFGWQQPTVLSPLLQAMLGISFAAFVWRALWRFGFTASEYGLVDGFRSIPRTITANYIAILAGRRAIFAYVKTLLGSGVSWDKTAHAVHPADLQPHVAA